MQVDVPPQPAATENSRINKSISLFLAKNQARNDASNRAEFLHSLAERRKRKRAVEDVDGDSTSIESNDAMDTDIRPKTCARVDAKAIDRDAQMKYVIAKDKVDEEVLSTPYPGLVERLKNIEDHIAVRFGTFLIYLFKCA